MTVAAGAVAEAMAPKRRETGRDCLNRYRQEKVTRSQAPLASSREIQRTDLPMREKFSLEKLCPRLKATKLSTILEMDPEAPRIDLATRPNTSGPMRIPKRR